MASNRPGEMQQAEWYSAIEVLAQFQWPQIGRVRCNQAGPTRWPLRHVSMASNRPGEMQRHNGHPSRNP